jgi:hypothetical protein
MCAVHQVVAMKVSAGLTATAADSRPNVTSISSKKPRRPL